MTQSEKRIWLIKELLEENPYYKNYKIPSNQQEQKNLLRALMNVRMPKPISKEFLDIQDEYLQEELRQEDIVDVTDLPCDSDERIAIWQGDITNLKIDAIVNAANSGMTGCYQPLHSCIDNIVHSKAGIELRLKCDEIMERQGHPEETGKAKITSAYNLPSKYVIHTVGPIVQGQLTKHDCEMLESCYRSILELAVASDVKTIAFCCISTGVFMFPNKEACDIAVDTVKGFLKEHKEIEKVVFNVFKDIDYELYSKKLKII
ncbi:MAG: protein-ADP-ribose hydrolase [Lachnospiraceae bacterium]|nr:protein-ADP-ribose hydrolase [Lachnospiraceae bacterium]